MKTLYQPILICRKYNSVEEEIVYYGRTYYDNYDDAEEDAFNARDNPKERIVIKEHMRH